VVKNSATSEWLRQISKVLHADWNPIGCDVPEDEYDSYAGPIATLLMKDAPDADIAAYLDRVEREMIRFDGALPSNRFAKVIAALKAIPRH
jgi:hypothetical protein